MADKFLDFIDMIDGGGYGEGKMGDKFEGGGIFSVLANALATPYGSEDEERMRKLRQMRGLLAPDESIAPKAAPRPTVTRGGGAGRAQVRPQTRPAQSMPNPQSGIPLPIGRPNPQGGMPMPLGKPSPQMGIPMPQAARAALQGPSPQAGMPIAMTDDDAFRIMVSQLGQTAVDRMSGQQFIQTLNQIKSQGRGM
jgi:hypothetical protein